MLERHPCSTWVPVSSGSHFCKEFLNLSFITWSTTVTTFLFGCGRLPSICWMIPKSPVSVFPCLSTSLQVWFAQTAFAKYHGGTDGQFLLPPMESGQIPLIKAQGLAEAI